MSSSRRSHAWRAATISALVVLAVFGSALPAAAAAATTVHQFNGVDGSMSTVRLIRATDGFLYGTTASSGVGGSDLDGVIFRISTAGAYQVVHRFDRCDPAGYNPLASLIQASDGFLYGTTSRGGQGNDCTGSQDTRSGVVYRLDPRTFDVTPIHTFALTADGHRPAAALVQGSDGALYGTTNVGGNTSLSYPLGRGTIFRVTLGGAFSVLHRFNGCDGHVPNAPLAAGKDGRLYGTTSERRCTAGNGTGTIFRISTTGVFKQLRIFSSSDGGQPVGRLVQAADGLFYGVTQKGGAYQHGVIYRISPKGTFKLLHQFGFDGGYATTGMQPRDGLVIAPDGAFYGTAQFGGVPIGPDRDGVIFKMNRKATKVGVVHTFMETEGGIQPLAGLLVVNGNLWGTAIAGPSGLGTIYRFALKATAALDSLSAYPEEIWTGYPESWTTGRVVLDGLAPTGGATVRLSSDRPDVVTIPSSVLVGGGWSVAQFRVDAKPVSQDTVVTINATYAGVTRQTTVNLYAAP